MISFTKQTLTDFENKLMVIKGEEQGEGINYEFVINIYIYCYV